MCCYRDGISLHKLQAFIFIETPGAGPNVGPNIPILAKLPNSAQIMPKKKKIDVTNTSLEHFFFNFTLRAIFVDIGAGCVNHISPFHKSICFIYTS